MRKQVPSKKATVKAAPKKKAAAASTKAPKAAAAAAERPPVPKMRRPKLRMDGSSWLGADLRAWLHLFGFHSARIGYSPSQITSQSCQIRCVRFTLTIGHVKHCHQICIFF